MKQMASSPTKLPQHNTLILFPHYLFPLRPYLGWPRNNLECGREEPRYDSFFRGFGILLEVEASLLPPPLYLGPSFPLF